MTASFIGLEKQEQTAELKPGGKLIVNFMLKANSAQLNEVTISARSGRFTFNLNNLTYQKYYIGYWSVNPQRPINVAGSIAFKF